jgi:hypothetical protein
MEEQLPVFPVGNKHKWHKSFLKVLENHEICYHRKYERDNHYIVKPEYSDWMDRFGIYSETYKIIINPMFNYIHGYTKPIKGYKNYTKTDMNILLDLMDKYLMISKRMKARAKIEKIMEDFQNAKF